MASVNKVILVGNLGKDPEVRHLEGGSTVCNFPLATSENYKDKSGNRVAQYCFMESSGGICGKIFEKGNYHFC